MAKTTKGGEAMDGYEQREHGAESGMHEGGLASAERIAAPALEGAKEASRLQQAFRINLRSGNIYAAIRGLCVALRQQGRDAEAGVIAALQGNPSVAAQPETAYLYRVANESGCAELKETLQQLWRAQGVADDTIAAWTNAETVLSTFNEHPAAVEAHMRRCHADSIARHRALYEEGRDAIAAVERLEGEKAQGGEVCDALTRAKALAAPYTGPWPRSKKAGARQGCPAFASISGGRETTNALTRLSRMPNG